MSESGDPRQLAAGQSRAAVGGDPAVAPASGRDAGLDALRGVAALLVVYLHSAVPYLERPMPGLVWPVSDTSSVLVSQLFWLIELFVMPLFLLLSGFFACRSLLRCDVRSFVRGRGQRLLRPLLFGVLVLLPLDYYLWLVGWVVEGRAPVSSLFNLKVPREARAGLYGLAHLWYLQYLLMYCVALAASVAWFTRRERLQRSATGSEPVLRLANRGGSLAQGVPRWLPISLLVMSGVVVAVAPEVVWGFQHSALPFLTKWIYCGTFFLGGVLLAVADGELSWLRRHSGRLLGAGCVCALAALPLGQWAVAQEGVDRAELASSLSFPIGLAARVSLAAITVTAAWGLSSGLLGAAVAWGGGLSSRRRLSSALGYLAAASFWLYLVHHPLVALAQIHLKLAWPGLSGGVKSLAVLAIATSVSLVSYQWVIRGRRLGVWLGLEPPLPRVLGEPVVEPTTSDVEPSRDVVPAAAARRAA